MKRTIAYAIIVLFLSTVTPRLASAESLSLAPLEYKASLQAGDKKKGHIDLINPEPRAVTVRLNVRGFRQADDNGGLDFFNDEKLRQGVLLDVNEVELEPNEGARIYFLLDSDKLPSGDVFAAIIAQSTARQPSVGANPAVEVGTLVMLTNGKAPDHHAGINDLQVPWWQTGEKLVAEMTIKNSDDLNGDALAFAPQISIAAWPYTSKTVDGPLIFAGRSRTISYQQPGNYFGPIKLTVTVDGHSKTAWLFAVTGYWRFIVPAAAVLLVVGLVSLRAILKRRRNRG